MSEGRGSKMPPPPPRKSGHLYKKTGIARKWKTRYFSLEGSMLCYYKREGDTAPQGIVMLTGCEIKPTRDKKYYSFRISHPKTSKVYDLAATLEGRTQDWIDALRDGAQVVFAQHPSTISTVDTSISTGHGRSDSLDSIPTMPEPEPTPSLSVSSFTMDESDLFVIASDDADLPTDHKADMEALMCEFMEQTRDDAEGWKLQTQERDCKVYVRAASRMGSCKSMGFINYHPYLMVKMLLEVHRRHSFDPQLQSAQRTLVYDTHTFIDHLTYKAIFPASARDFVHVTHWRVLHNGSILLVATSLKNDEQYPPKRDVVRGRTVLGGFLITPNEAYTGAHVQYIVKADVKGGMPTALQTRMFVKQAFVIDGLRRALDDEEYDTTQLAELPRVTNRTVFDIRATDEEEHDDARSFSGSASTDADDTGDEDWSRPTITIPQEGLPAVPAKYREMIQKAIARMDVEMMDSSWNFHSEKHGVKAYTKIDGSLTAAKGEMHVAIHPRALWDTIMDVERRKTFDSQLAKGTRLKTLDAQTSIDYLEYKPIFVVSGRDFCNLVHWRVLSNGTIIVVAQSIEDNALCPSKEPKIVRGDLHIAGWKIVPDAEYKECDVTFMVQTDVKGNIPARIMSKVASEQPYIIHQMVQMLKKTDLSRFESQGPLTNTVFDQAVALAMQSRSSVTKRSSSSAVRRSGVTKKSTSSRGSSSRGSSPSILETEPTPEPQTKEVVPKKLPEEVSDVLGKPDDSTSTTNFLVTNAVQFVLAIFGLKLVSLPGVLHYGVVVYLAAYFVTMMYMGPSHMTPRRKLMIATFGPPDSGMILGTLSIDMTKTQQYIAEKRAKSGDHITITHIVLRALGSALARTPSVNGHLVFGNYYQAPSVDISCLVAVAGGKDLGVCRLPACDKMTLKEVCNRVRGDATKLRSGKDKAQEDRNKLMTILPTWAIRPITTFVSWLGGSLGLRIPPVGIEPYMFGSCMVTSVGMMGLELAFAPITPYAQTPMLVTIGAIKDTVVVEDGKIVIRPMLTLTTTIDHRYVDGSQAARMAAWMKQCIEDPSNIEPVDL